MLLRDYQSEGIAAIREDMRANKKVLYVLPTGGGKTVIFTEIAKRMQEGSKKVLILVHRHELLRQLDEWLSKIGIPHAVFHADYSYATEFATVVVSTIQTASRKLTPTRFNPDLIILDECFPAGTLIDGVSIEKIKAGDFVNSYNHTSGQIEKREVKRLFKKKSQEICEVRLSNGVKIICTPNHPIFSACGYIAASLLKCGDMVYSITENNDELQNMWKTNGKKSRKFKLQSDLLKRLFDKIKLIDNGLYKQSSCFPKNDKKQSYEKPCLQRKAKNNSTGDGMEASSTRRKWKASAVGTSCASIILGLANRVCFNNKENEQASKPYKNRYSQSKIKGGDRGGRSVSSKFREERAGQKKGRLLDGVRVESIKVHKQGNSKRFDRLCPEGFVYNIEVEHNHNYFANNVLVHNCHHSTAKQWSKYITETNTYTLGVTATPARLDGKGLGNIFDNMILGPEINQLVEDGYLARPVVYAPPSDFSTDDLHTKMGDYNVKEAEAGVQKSTIMGDAIEHYRKFGNSQPAIGFAVTVRQAEIAAANFNNAGIPAASIDGSMGKAQRKQIINDLASGAIKVITSCELVSEGVDIPAVSTAMLWRPTKSVTVFLQQVGRALRPVYAEGFDLSTQEGRLAAIAAGPKPHAVILDHVGNCLKLGHPLMGRQWTLEDGYKKDKIQTPRLCKSCYAVMSSWVAACPVCGAVFAEQQTKTKPAMAQVAGELKEYKPDWAHGADIIKMPIKDALRAAQTWEQLEEIARAKGYKRGWVQHVMKARSQRGRSSPSYSSG